MDGIERHESVKLQYRKLGERKGSERMVDPYLLHIQAGAVYLIGFCHQRNAVRTFLLDRITEAARIGALFGARAPFAANNLLQGALGPWEGKPQMIQLRFDAEIAELAAKRQMHPSQKSQWRSDGELDVELRAPMCPPLVSWLLGWGEHVLVVSSAVLADRVRATGSVDRRGRADGRGRTLGRFHSVASRGHQRTTFSLAGSAMKPLCAGKAGSRKMGLRGVAVPNRLAATSASRDLRLVNLTWTPPPFAAWAPHTYEPAS